MAACADGIGPAFNNGFSRRGVEEQMACVLLVPCGRELTINPIGGFHAAYSKS
jgi:hypothetical protein